MVFAQHFFRLSNFPKNKFAPAGISGGANRSLRETVVQIPSKSPHLHNFSQKLLAFAAPSTEDAVQITPWEGVLHNTSHQFHIRRYNACLYIQID